jgi:hypothetical protein
LFEVPRGSVFPFPVFRAPHYDDHFSMHRTSQATTGISPALFSAGFLVHLRVVFGVSVRDSLP